jgi:Fe2+ or Zn2+ uptake regulation protein
MTEAYGTPGLRDKIIDIICKEWQNPEKIDNEIAAATIFGRLQSEGVEASVLTVHNALYQLGQRGEIVLNLPAEHHPFTDISILRVSQELCE